MSSSPSDLAVFDRLVGRIAGAIYSDVSHVFPQPPLLLVPAITFKVRRVLESVTDLKYLTSAQKKILANDLRVSIVPMLFSYEIEPETIEELAPIIETAAFKGLSTEGDHHEKV